MRVTPVMEVAKEMGAEEEGQSLLGTQHLKIWRVRVCVLNHYWSQPWEAGLCALFIKHKRKLRLRAVQKPLPGPKVAKLEIFILYLNLRFWLQAQWSSKYIKAAEWNWQQKKYPTNFHNFGWDLLTFKWGRTHDSVCGVILGWSCQGK